MMWMVGSGGDVAVVVVWRREEGWLVKLER